MENRIADELFCEKENVKVLGTKKKLNELPILIRVGIAKWFVNRNLFCVDVEEILNTGINYSSFINARKIRKYFNKKYPDVIAIDPVEKFYMTKNEIKELTGFSYVKKPTKCPQDKTPKIKETSNEISVSENGPHLRRLSVAGTKRKCKKNKQKPIKIKKPLVKKTKGSLYEKTISEIRKYLG